MCMCEREREREREKERDKERERKKERKKEIEKRNPGRPRKIFAEQNFDHKNAQYIRWSRS